MENGPVPDRGCTDILCCLVFICFLVGMGGVTAYGLLQGDPYLLLTTWDANGNGCGYNTTTKDYPYLYFPTIDLEAAKKADPSVKSISDVLRFGVCVKTCPTGNNPVICKKPTYMIQ
jgi:choline transporter-like protein 2/4/5